MSGPEPLSLAASSQLASELLEDQEDSRFFDKLTYSQSATEVLQSDFLQLLADSVVNIQADIKLSDFGVRRLAELLETASISSGGIELSLNLLTLRNEVADSRYDRDTITLAAISFLQRAAKDLTTEQIMSLVVKASRYGTIDAPIGQYLENGRTIFDCVKHGDEVIDFAGAGAILLLPLVRSDRLSIAIEKVDRDLLDATIRFSKQHPDKPNLYLSVMHIPALEPELIQLHRYQHDKLPDSEVFEMIMRSIKRSMRWSILAGPALSVFAKAKLGLWLGNFGPAEAFFAFIGAAGAAGIVDGFYQFFKTLREHKLSPKHRGHLEAVVASVQKGKLHPLP